jgi:hypothetical protein
MSALDEPPLDSVHRRREWADAVNERRLARLVEGGQVVRLAPGSFATAGDWSRLKPIDRHAQRVWEAASRTARGTVFSHWAVAALRGTEVMGRWPDYVDVSVERTSGGRSTGQLRRHTRRLDNLDLEPWGEHFITSSAQTAIDLAAVLPFTEGVVVADRTLWSRRTGGPLATQDELMATAAAFAGRGAVRAWRVAEFASPESDSVGETRSRVGIHRLGFPPPVLQQQFALPSGRLVRSDTYWPEWDHVGEFDGIGKYVDPTILRGRSPRQALIEEKDREDELRRVVRGLSRWRTPQLDRLALLHDILTRAGLPSSRPRPGY